MTAKQGNLDITKGPLKLSVFFAKVNSGSLAYGSECCIPAKLSVVTVRLYGESICVHHTIKAGAPDLSSSPTDRWNSRTQDGMPAGNSGACRRSRETPREGHGDDFLHFVEGEDIDLVVDGSLVVDHLGSPSFLKMERFSVTSRGGMRRQPRESRISEP